MIVSIWRNLWCLSACKKLTSFFTFFLRYCKILQTCCFGCFEHAWFCKPKVILTSCRKLLCLLASKKSTSSPCSSEDIAKIWKLLILGTLGMPSYTHSEWQYQILGDFDVYLNAKNKIYHSFLSWHITF